MVVVLLKWMDGDQPARLRWWAATHAVADGWYCDLHTSYSNVPWDVYGVIVDAFLPHRQINTVAAGWLHLLAKVWELCCPPRLPPHRQQRCVRACVRSFVCWWSLPSSLAAVVVCVHVDTSSLVRRVAVTERTSKSVAGSQIIHLCRLAGGSVGRRNRQLWQRTLGPHLRDDGRVRSHRRTRRVRSLIQLVSHACNQ